MSNNSETYRNDPLGKPRGRAKHSFLTALCVILLLAVTISFAIALIIAYLTPYVPPATFGSLTIVGIFAPILYMVVALCCLMWIIAGRWKIVGLVALLLIPGLFRVSDFYNIDFLRKVEDTKPVSHSLSIMSYNLRGFRNDISYRAVDGYVDYFANMELTDVVCLQEYALNIQGVERVDSVFKARYTHIYSNDVVEAGDVVLRTHSRHPIIASGNLSGEGRGTSQWVDVVVNKRDTVRIFNNHLHTMSISAVDSEDIAQGTILQDGDRMRSIVDRIANNSSIRASYVDTLRSVVMETPHSNIVCGDFNDTPMSYVYKKLMKHHKDAFVESGSGYGYTFRPMYGTLRIDYILISEDMDAASYYADQSIILSDHLPIRAVVKLPSK